MKPIGGYFELELDKKKEYYPNFIKLNTGRNAFEYILRVQKYTKILLPYYSCDSLLEPLHKLDIQYEFYSLNSNFFPNLSKRRINTNEAILYINYFGINDYNVKQIVKNHGKVIIDNSQSFFSKPITNVNTFYSPRKFFGVPDGGYLYISKYLKNLLPEDISYNKMLHLLKRLESSPEMGYNDYLKSENLLKNQPIKKMSKLTQKILESINYRKIKRIRLSNFNYFHKHLSQINELEIINKFHCPLVYPLLIKKAGVRQYLLNKKIYLASYWKEVLNRVSVNSFEYDLINYLLPLPIDQRYSLEELKIIIDLINKIK